MEAVSNILVVRGKGNELCTDFCKFKFKKVSKRIKEFLIAHEANGISPDCVSVVNGDIYVNHDIIDIVGVSGIKFYKFIFALYALHSYLEKIGVHILHDPNTSPSLCMFRIMDKELVEKLRIQMEQN